MTDAPLCYAFDPASGLYLGALAADPSPLEPGVWLYPGSTCLDAPPSAKGQWPVRQGSAWTLMPDHRGETWWSASGHAVTIAAVGDPATAGLVSTAPPAPAAPQPYLTGRDVVDGMSPAQAKAADAEDPRNLARISAARTAAEVKSCIARVAKANGMTTDALLAQATATGGV